MSYLLFLDESGHDHKTCPYEVHGGVCLAASRVWPFTSSVIALEEEAFGTRLSQWGVELKGHKLLDKDRFKWAAQEPPMPSSTRRLHARAFLAKSQRKEPLTRSEFTAYGQANLLMAQGMFRLLAEQDALVFAVCIPRGIERETVEGVAEAQYLRKDWVYLLERYAYFLQSENETGLLVQDQTETSSDRRLIQRFERYFTLTVPGRQRAAHIVPTPLFVASDLTYPIQAADICAYCINWGFRLPERGMDAPTRPEVENLFAEPLRRLQWRGQGERDGKAFTSYGIVYLSQVHGAPENKKEAMPPAANREQAEPPQLYNRET